MDMRTSRAGPARQAFFLDGDDIEIKAENDVIRGRYKIIRIGINSAAVEDLTKSRSADAAIGGGVEHMMKTCRHRQENERGFALLFVFLMAAVVALVSLLAASSRGV